MTFGPSDGGASVCIHPPELSREGDKILTQNQNSNTQHAKVHSLDDFKACLDAFQAAGYDEVDTARAYCSGKQENFTAQAGYKGRKLTLATKCYPSYKGAHTKTELLGTMTRSLKELETENVDIFYLHAADRTTPFYETLEAINEAHKQGKFKIFAISNFTASEFSKMISSAVDDNDTTQVAEVCMICKYNNFVRPTLYQGAYNVINRTPEYDLVPTLRRHGLDWVIYNPLAGGMLTGKYLSKDDEKSGRFAGEGVAEIYAKRYWKDQTFAALNVINDAAKTHELSMIEVALRWAQHHSALNMRTKGGNDGIVIGASSLDQLQQNLEYFTKGPLPEDVVQACDKAWQEMAGSRPLYYHGEFKYEYDTVKALYGEGAK
ncbi:hypothetical protein FRB96_004445 [Tulasnella sp. 330]|nr:hypothetical protein FRB96_004445 [Tulasnella sp. 330]KAG8870966.1 hypothetical protein FRB97_009212 [Tulasnella sp. 331]KAG8875084.1 hypothetical protein FRB98_008105 [Tulasnella sp. 332]